MILFVITLTSMCNEGHLYDLCMPAFWPENTKLQGPSSQTHGLSTLLHTYNLFNYLAILSISITSS